MTSPSTTNAEDTSDSPVTISLHSTIDSPDPDDSPDTDPRVIIAATITNQSDDDVTLSAMTSNVLQWNVTDTNGHSYIPVAGSLQAPHFITIRPGKTYVTTLTLGTPEAIQADYSELDVFDDATIVTDPVEFHEEYRDKLDDEQEPNAYLEPGVPVTLERELTASLTVSIMASDHRETEQITFTPAELDPERVEHGIPDDITIDDGATLNITTGRNDSDDDQQSRWTLPSADDDPESWATLTGPDENEDTDTNDK